MRAGTRKPPTGWALRVGEAIQHYRLAAKLTQADFAAEVGAHETSVGNWELYGAITLGRLPEVALVLGIEVSDIFKRAEATNGHD